MSKNSIIIIVVILVLLGGWYVFTQKSPTPVNTEAVSTTKEFTLTVADKKITSGETTLKVAQGDTVILHITSDIEEELHIHGYDVSTELSPEEPVTLEFVADVSGRFPFELEESKVDLGAIEVAPQ